MVKKSNSTAESPVPWFRSTTFRWAIMISFLFWVLVFRLGGEVSKLPEFVYVNF